VDNINSILSGEEYSHLSEPDKRFIYERTLMESDALYPMHTIRYISQGLARERVESQAAFLAAIKGHSSLGQEHDEL
jgi:hypothetical protein